VTVPLAVIVGERVVVAVYVEETLWLARRDQEDVAVIVAVWVGLLVIAGVAVWVGVRGGVFVGVGVAVAVPVGVGDGVVVSEADIVGVNVWVAVPLIV
jgi:hypothetical protein